MSRDKPIWAIWENMYSGLYDANDSWVAYCPKCERDLDDIDTEIDEYCPRCGQRLLFHDYQVENHQNEDDQSFIDVNGHGE